MVDVSVAYCISHNYSMKSHAVTADFCRGHWVTGGLVVWSCCHR